MRTRAEPEGEDPRRPRLRFDVPDELAEKLFLGGLPFFRREGGLRERVNLDVRLRARGVAEAGDFARVLLRPQGGASSGWDG
jgi:hypothetical protein